MTSRLVAKSAIKTKLLEINIMNKITQLQQTAISAINGGLSMNIPLPRARNNILNPFNNPLIIDENADLFDIEADHFIAIPIHVDNMYNPTRYRN